MDYLLKTFIYAFITVFSIGIAILDATSGHPFNMWCACVATVMFFLKAVWCLVKAELEDHKEM